MGKRGKVACVDLTQWVKGCPVSRASVPLPLSRMSSYTSASSVSAGGRLGYLCVMRTSRGLFPRRENWEKAIPASLVLAEWAGSTKTPPPPPLFSTE